MNPDNENQKKEQPPFCNVVEGYLRGIDGEPAGRTPDTLGLWKTKAITSQEIVIATADMADLDINDVAASMTYLGYSCGLMEGKLGWLVKIRH